MAFDPTDILPHCDSIKLEKIRPVADLCKPPLRVLYTLATQEFAEQVRIKYSREREPTPRLEEIQDHMESTCKSMVNRLSSSARLTYPKVTLSREEASVIVADMEDAVRQLVAKQAQAQQLNLREISQSPVKPVWQHFAQIPFIDEKPSGEAAIHPKMLERIKPGLERIDELTTAYIYAAHLPDAEKDQRQIIITERMEQTAENIIATLTGRADKNQIPSVQIVPFLEARNFVETYRKAAGERTSATILGQHYQPLKPEIIKLLAGNGRVSEAWSPNETVSRAR